MVKQKDYTWVGIVLVVLVLVWGGQAGWFNKVTYITNQDLIYQLDNPSNLEGISCSLSLDKTEILQGEYLFGTISDGKNTLCEVYGKYQGQWAKLWEGKTNFDGTVRASEIINLVGEFQLVALCGQGNTDQCITNEVVLNVLKDTDGDGFSDDDETEQGTDPNDPNSYPGSSETGFNCNTFCIGKGYLSGRPVDSCSYCNTIDEVCDVPLDALITGACCCKQGSFDLGCNDADFTQTNFDASILTSTHCIDDLGTHLDSCDGNLLEEWSCPVVGDTCSNTFINCEAYLPENIVGCKDGACVVFCEDSDDTGGSIEQTELSFKTFGNCQNDGVTYLDECSGSTLTEYYCSGMYNADGSIIRTSCAISYKDCSEFGEDWGCVQGKCRLI